jgi:hypothetical protein
MSSYWFGVLPFVLTITWAGLAPAEELGSLPRELVGGEDPQETYDLNALGLVHGRLTKAVLFGIPLTTTETWRPVRGKYRYELSRADFFERVGRADLASQQRSTDTWSDVLFYGGLLIAVSGIAYPLFLGDTEEVFQAKNLVITGSLLLGGIVISNVGTAISGPVTDVATATSFARQYNLALARRVQAQKGATLRLALGTGAGAVFSVSC